MVVQSLRDVLSAPASNPLDPSNKPQAMIRPQGKRYLEIDWPEAPATVLVQAQVPSPSIPTAPALPSEHVQEADQGAGFERRKARVEADHAALVSAGFDTSKAERLAYKAGHNVNATGVENAEKARRQYDALPDAHEALASFQSQIRDERREDVVIDPSTLHLDGWDLSTEAGVYPLEVGSSEVQSGGSGDEFKISGGFGGSRESVAFDGLCRTLGFGNGSGFLASRSAELRTGMFNATVSELVGNGVQNEGQRAKVKASAAPASASESPVVVEESEEQACGSSWLPELPDKAKLRTRSLDGGARSVFAVVGKGYVPLDADRVIERIVSLVPRGAKADVTYDRSGSRWIVDVVFASNVAASDYATGEYFRAAMRVRGDDVGRGAVSCEAAALRNLCENLYILGTSKMKLGRFIHRGDSLTTLERVAQAMGSGVEALAPFLEAWGYTKARVLSPESGSVSVLAQSKLRGGKSEVPAWGECTRDQRVAALLGGLAQTTEIPIRQKMVVDLVSAYNRDVLADGPITQAALASCLNRYAHEVCEDRWTADALERAAGTLTWSRAAVPAQMAYVYTLG